MLAAFGHIQHILHRTWQHHFLIRHWDEALLHAHPIKSPLQTPSGIAQCPMQAHRSQAPTTQSCTDKQQVLDVQGRRAGYRFSQVQTMTCSEASSWHTPGSPGLPVPNRSCGMPNIESSSGDCVPSSTHAQPMKHLVHLVQHQRHA